MPVGTSSVIVSKTNLSGMGAISPEPYENITDPVELAKYIPSVYGGINFSVDIAFTVDYYVSAISQGIVNATDVTCSFNFSAYGITATKLNSYTYRITGAFSSLFSEYYTFVLKDNTIAVLPADTSVDFLALIEYQMPSPTLFNNTYNFTVTSPTDSIAYPMYQTVVWSYQSAVSSVQALTAQGI